MTDAATCSECGTTVSYDTGFSITGGLGDSSEDRIWCPEHAPDKGKGYTLADMEKWREESQVQRAEYEMSQMNLVGADVYFAVKDKRSPMKRLLKMQQRMNNTIARLTDPGRDEAPPSSGS
jgi:hypothetical protein